jgi:hypothetical protein
VVGIVDDQDPTCRASFQSPPETVRSGRPQTLDRVTFRRAGTQILRNDVEAVDELAQHCTGHLPGRGLVRALSGWSDLTDQLAGNGGLTSAAGAYEHDESALTESPLELPQERVATSDLSWMIRPYNHTDSLEWRRLMRRWLRVVRIW